MPVSQLVVTRTDVPAACVPAVDVHNHLGRWMSPRGRWRVPDVPALVDELRRLNVSAVVNLDGRWGPELEANLDRYDRAHPGRFATFCHLDWGLLAGGQGPKKLLQQLQESANAGAKGLKVWKDLGLSVRDSAGRLVGVDDARLADIWDAAGEMGLPVLIHTADPIAFWQPLDRNNERLEELARNPAWQHHRRGAPPHGQLIDAFERMVGAHGDTTFIAAHLASCEHDLSRVGQMLASHPNLVVDLSAREAELGRQPRAAKAFLEKHRDRVLWGSDGFPFHPNKYRTWFRMLETEDEYFAYRSDGIPSQGRWAISGLGLSQDVLAKVYAANARRLITALQ